MTTKNFSTTATTLIGNFGNGAHHVIGLYREGGERLIGTVEQRYKAALKQNAAKLTPETRKNAAHLQQVVSGYYAKGLALSADGAEVVVDTIVGAAVAAIDRAKVYQQANARKSA
jgi:hypothetical protein